MSKFDRDYYIGASKSSYEDYSMCRGVLDTYAQMLEDTFKPTSVFDGGCAYGFVVDWFNANGKVAKGCDLSDFASSHSSSCYVGDLTAIPEEDCSYYLVTSTEVLEHVPEDSVRKVITELYRVSGKYLVMLVGTFPEGTKEDPNDLTHITFHPIEWWNGVVEELGLIRDFGKECVLNGNEYSKYMNWSNRFIVVVKP